MPETVEGQDIALEILGDSPERGWIAFRERYENLLKRQAGAILRWAPTLRSFGQAEDLVQGFLVDQVISRPRAMLSPTAHGEQPLWPRLSRSFTNYCNQILRRLARQPKLMSERAIEAEAVAEVSNEGDHNETWVRIDQGLLERQDAIRCAFNEREPGSVPLLHLLLLSERLSLAQLIESSFAATDLRPSPEVPVPDLVSRIVPWSDREQRENLPPQQYPLGEGLGFIDKSSPSGRRR